MGMAESLDIVKREVEDVLSMGEELQIQIAHKTDELESLRERADSTGANVQSYLENLEGLQDSLSEFEYVRDEAATFDIEV